MPPPGTLNRLFGDPEAFDRAVAEMLGERYPPSDPQQMLEWLKRVRDLLPAGDDREAVVDSILQVERQIRTQAEASPSPDIFAARPTPKAVPFQEAPITGGSSSSRDRELMPPPEDPPAKARPPRGWPIGTTQPLDWLVRNRSRLPAMVLSFNDEFYRRVARINQQDLYVRPQTAQEKYTVVRDALRRLRPTRDADASEYQELEREYDRLFPLVSFEFPNPEQQRAEDLGLEYV